MSHFETTTDFGRKRYIMDELVVECDLIIYHEIRQEFDQFLKSSIGMKDFYATAIHDTKEYIRKYANHGPNLVMSLMIDVINDITRSPENDHIIKHAVYILRNGKAQGNDIFRFLHALEYLINERRIRLL